MLEQYNWNSDDVKITKKNKKRLGVISWNGVGFFTLVVDFIDLTPPSIA
jgi:hypothetical protein